MNQSKQLPLTFLPSTNLPETHLQENEIQDSLGTTNNNKHRRIEHVPNQFRLLIVDRISSSSCFLCLDFISKALRAGRPVLFLSFNLSYDHWSSLLQKQSIQLNSSRYKDSFKFIDGLNLNLNQETDTEKISKILTELINNEVIQLSRLSKQSPLVLIDDLTTVIWSGLLSSTQWIDCFQSIFPSRCHPKPFSLIMVFHDDLLTSNVRDREVFNHLVSRSDLILRTRALAGSGRGELIVQRGPNNLVELELPVTLSVDQTTQYKIIDHSVTYYPKGLDKGFI